MVSERVAFCQGDQAGNSCVNHARLVVPGTSKDGVLLFTVCVAFRKHPHDSKGELVFLWGDGCSGFDESGEAYFLGPFSCCVTFPGSQHVEYMWPM